MEGQRSSIAHAEDILALFHSLLQYNSVLLKRLTDEDLEKSAHNAKGDTVRIPDIIGGFVKHVHNHLGQIERIKQTALAAH